jgi:hypothetical protein
LYEDQKPQWTMTVTIYHGPSFGHAIELATETRGRITESTHDSIGSWRGVGCPNEVLQQAEALIGAAFTYHVVARYGVAETLEGWGPEPGPF